MNFYKNFCSCYFFCKLKSKVEEAAKINRNDEVMKQWDGWTAKFAAAANIPFLLLQLPQIWLNAQNLMAGNNSALLAVNWLVSLIYTPCSQFFFKNIFFFRFRTSKSKSSVKNIAGLPNWFACESFAAFILCQEKRDRSNDSAMPGNCYHLCNDFTVSNG